MAGFVRSGEKAMSEYNKAANITGLPLKRGWARRPGWGKQYGAAYVKQYSKAIEDLFNKGAKHSSIKMNPRWFPRCPHPEAATLDLCAPGPAPSCPS